MNYLLPKNKSGYDHITSLYEKIESNLFTQKLGIAVTNELQEYQPFILYIMDSFKTGSQKKPSKSLRKIYFLIWMYYSKSLIARETPITWERYAKAEYDTATKVDHLDCIKSIMEQKEKIFYKLRKNTSKTLFATILLQFRASPDLETMNRKSGGAIILSIRSFIQCFDEITSRKRV